MLSALCYLIGLFLSIAVLADWFDVEFAWFGVFLFAGLLLSAVGIGPPVTWRPRQ